LSVLLLASRAIMGFGYGTVILIITAVLPKITPLEELPGVFQRRLLNVIVGEGLGPLAAAAAYLLDFCPRSAAPRFELVGGVQLMVSLFALVAAILFFLAFNQQRNKKNRRSSEVAKHDYSYHWFHIGICALLHWCFCGG